MAHIVEGGFGDNRYRTTTAVSDNVSYSWWVKTNGPTQHEMRSAKAQGILERICSLTGHAGACGLLSDCYRFDIKGFYLAIPNPLYRMWLYILTSARG
jgi:hypothetical protein